jgi:uncharacterized protein YecE (DUF72 family)
MPRAHVGTSGWIYKHWKHLFYAGVKQADWLAHYARHFDTVEINAPFYRLPTARAMAALPDRVPAGFRFAVKMWRGVTHYRKLKDARDLLDKFMPNVNALPPTHRGPLLVQLPPNLHRNDDRLDTFLHTLRDTFDAAGWQVAVEFRSIDWVTPEISAILTRHAAALALSDMPDCTITGPNDAPLVYVRRHGTWGKYNGSYAPEQIAADAAQINRWLRAGRDVWLYYNNDIDGHAVVNAQQLRHALRPRRSQRAG